MESDGSYLLLVPLTERKLSPQVGSAVLRLGLDPVCGLPPSPEEAEQEQEEREYLAREARGASVAAAERRTKESEREQEEREHEDAGTGPPRPQLPLPHGISYDSGLLAMYRHTKHFLGINCARPIHPSSVLHDRFGHHRQWCLRHRRHPLPRAAPGPAARGGRLLQCRELSPQHRDLGVPRRGSKRSGSKRSGSI
jgi:hypothetical protein